jgi:hypothetical protein
MASSCFATMFTGLMQATPGEIKSFKSSAERMADISQPMSGEVTCEKAEGEERITFEYQEA